MSVIEFELPPETVRPIPENDLIIDLRRSERALTDLKTIIQVNEGDDDLWKEVTKVNTVIYYRDGDSVTL